jgi:virginiamycin B lyase
MSSWIVRSKFLAIIALGGVTAAVTLATSSAQSSTQSTQPSGSLAGTVTQDGGQVVAFRVKARDVVHRMSYTVYTRKGAYSFVSLPPSKYEVQVLEEDYVSPVVTVDVKAASSAVANFELKRKKEGDGVELVDFDTLFPPEPARETMRLNGCFSCHWGGAYVGRRHHDRGGRTEEGWRRGVETMFRPRASAAKSGESGSVGAVLASSDRISTSEKEGIVKYLAKHFPLGAPRRDLKLDPLVRDEEALSGTMYVQYELKRSLGAPFDGGMQPQPNTHSVAVSPVTPGVVWLSGLSSSFVKVNTRDLNFETRTTEYPYRHPNNRPTSPHGIREFNGSVWAAEMGGHRVSRLDVKSGDVQAYKLPQEGGSPHDVWPDSKGKIWYTYWSTTGMVGYVNPATGQTREWKLDDGFAGYGVIVDRADRVWVASLNTPAVFMYDQVADKWTKYPTSNPTRRVTLDSKGNVWACQYFGNKIARIEPTSGKVTEYEMPLRYGAPYEVWADHNDNLWIENSTYNSLIRFDPKSERFTYFPFPEFAAHTYKVDTDSEGNVWFGLDWTWDLKKRGEPATLTVFKPKGNLPAAGR